MIDDTSKEFIKRHIGPSEQDQKKILNYIGSKSIDQLMIDTVPNNILLKEKLKINQSMSESDALKKLKSIIIEAAPFGQIVKVKFSLWSYHPGCWVFASLSLNVPKQSVTVWLDILYCASSFNEKIRNEVLKNNLSFWLNCDTQMLLGRIKKNQRRPIAFNLSDSELTELITKRTKIYSKAQFKINCRKLKKTEIVKKILKIYERN